MSFGTDTLSEGTPEIPLGLGGLCALSEHRGD